MPMERAAFTAMADGAAEEYEFLGGLWRSHRDAHLADSVLALLEGMRGPTLGYNIDRNRHSLQSATRAMRKGADEETIVVALLHDVADTIAPDNHGEVAAAMLRPYISEANHRTLKHHGLFQGYYYFDKIGGNRDARTRHRGHPHFAATAAFRESWDQCSFDPDYDTAPLAHFEPMVRRVLAPPRRVYD